MPLSEQQQEFYREIMRAIGLEMEGLDKEIERALGIAKEHLAELQSAKAACRQIYDGACIRLGIPNDLEAAEGSGRRTS